MARLKWLVLGISLALAGAGTLWLWRTVRLADPAEIARRISRGLEERLHAAPTVFVDKRVVVEEKRPIAELALVSRDTQVEHRMESERFFSSAELRLRAAFAVKAGFDLRGKSFALHLDKDLSNARLHLPGPRVLSVEMTGYEVLEDRSGWWNRVSEFDREMAVRQMHADAKLEAIRAGILDDCRLEMEKLLAGLSDKTGVKLEYRYGVPANSLRERKAAESPLRRR